jgi:hypothetical protein
MVWLQVSQAIRLNWHLFTFANAEFSTNETLDCTSTLTIRGLVVIQRLYKVLLVLQITLTLVNSIWSKCRQKAVLGVAGGMGLTPGPSIAT